MKNEITSSARAIQRAIGRAPQFVRPPYGATNAGVQVAAGAPIVNWNVDTLDWKTRSTPATVRAATTNIAPGSIILMHDIHLSTVAVRNRARLKAQGFTLVTVGQILQPLGPQAGKVYYRGRWVDFKY